MHVYAGDKGQCAEIATWLTETWLGDPKALSGVAKVKVVSYSSEASSVLGN